MERSIDVSYLKRIYFGDPKLLPQIIEAWVADIDIRMESIHLMCSKVGCSLFKELHELKTNFAMISFQEGIYLIEELIKIDKTGHNIPPSYINRLDQIVQEVKESLLKAFPNLD
jgi:hypothetical protein